MNPPPTPPSTNRRPVLLLFVLFAAPLAGAFWLYYGSSWRPALRTNHGELLTPVTLPELALPRAGSAPPATAAANAAANANATVVAPAMAPAMAPAKVLRGKWSLLVIGHGEAGCDATCRNALVYARQTWLSLAQLTPRAQRVLLAGAGCCDLEYLQREHAGLIALDASGTAAEALVRLFPAARDGAIFIVDPLGNLMMRYDVRQDPKGLREDLKKLLELSHIG